MMGVSDSTTCVGKTLIARSLSAFDPSGLSDAERLLLAGELLDMTDRRAAAFTAEQIAELEQRDAEADAGLVQGETWEIVRERLKQLK